MAAFTIPLMALIGLNFRGGFSFLTPVYAFVIVPVLEVIMPIQTSNLTKEEIENKAHNQFFDFLLYLNVPIIYGIISWFLWSLQSAHYETYEMVGLVFSIGIVLGSNGINVAHELGHRTRFWERTLGKILLVPALYSHFYIEHNFGHHMNAATAEDPASAKYNQTLYSFWFTSITRQYVSSWKIQLNLLGRENLSFLSLKNDLFWGSMGQLIYLGVIAFFFGIKAAGIAMIIALIGVVLLETINYIEHYGLSRNKTASGRYERVREIHSWNSNHVLGRVMLYELTRHSDHHYRAHKKYQLLDCHDSSPQMPYGYPTSMVLSLIPPLWFSIMNKRIPEEMRKVA